MKLYQVYVLQNAEGRHYIGLSEDVKCRLEQHNNGESRYTRGKGPWKLIWVSELMELGAARKLENHLKRQKGGVGFHRYLQENGTLFGEALSGS